MIEHQTPAGLAEFVRLGAQLESAVVEVRTTLAAHHTQFAQAYRQLVDARRTIDEDVAVSDVLLSELPSYLDVAAN